MLPRAKKAVAREERRVARNQRRADREAGVIPDQAQDGSPFDPARQEPTAEVEEGGEV